MELLFELSIFDLDACVQFDVFELEMEMDIWFDDGNGGVNGKVAGRVNTSCDDRILIVEKENVNKFNNQQYKKVCEFKFFVFIITFIKYNHLTHRRCLDGRLQLYQIMHHAHFSILLVVDYLNVFYFLSHQVCKLSCVFCVHQLSLHFLNTIIIVNSPCLHYSLHILFDFVISDNFVCYCNFGLS